MLEDSWQKAIAIGRRNKETIDLLKNHCSHVLVEKPVFGGQGMAEASTGLPIDMRTVRCQYAAHPAGAGMQLELIALEFWRANCRGCPHRQPVGLPNLTTKGEAMLEAERTAQEQAQRERASREADRQIRSARRAHEVAAEPASTRWMIKLLDGIDAEKPDVRARRLVDEAHAAPERCTPTAAKVLLETARIIPSDHLLEALGYLQRYGAVPAERLLEIALLGLAAGPSRVAAQLVVRLKAGLREGMLTDVIPSLIMLAGRSSDLIERTKPYVDGLLLAAEIALPALLEELSEGIGDGHNTWRRMRYAYAAAELMRARPEVAQLLAPALVHALTLPDSLDVHAGSPGLGLREALSAAFEAQPSEVETIYEKLGTSLSEEARRPVFMAYDKLFRGRLRAQSVPHAAAEIALDAVLRHISGDWGEEIKTLAVATLELISKYHPAVIVDRAEVVFGALLNEIAPPTTPAPDLLNPASPMQALEATSRDLSRRNRSSRLRSVVSNLAPLKPEETLAFIEAVLQGSGLPAGEAADTLRGHAVRLMGTIGQMSEYVGRVLPRLVAIALGSDVIMRTRAIQALGDLSDVPHRRLPGDVTQLLPIWLTDPYRGPHRAAVEAMSRGFPVEEGVLAEAVRALIALGEAYATKDDDFLDDVLDQLWTLATRLDPASAEAVRKFCLKKGQHLSHYDLERFLERRGARHLTPGLASVFADRLLEILSHEERLTDPNARDDNLMKLLRDLPAPVLRSRLKAIRAAAVETAPYAIWSALQYVEVLQRAFAWEEAVDLATALRDGVEDTIENREIRLLASIILAAARFELAVMRGESDVGDDALRSWDELTSLRHNIEHESRSTWQLRFEQ